MADMMTRLFCSRSDRLGDLVLTLPALALLKRANPNCHRVLHVSEYAADLGYLALRNGLCETLVFADEESGLWTEEGIRGAFEGPADLIAFFHGPLVVDLKSQHQFDFTLGPRSKLSTLWTYSRTIAQKRSRVEKSEMEYNLDLARSYLEHRGIANPDFEGLPALQIPPEWKVEKAPVLKKIAAVFVNNGASAQNWPLQEFLKCAEQYQAQGFEVELHYGGVQAPKIYSELLAEKVLERGMKIIDPFPKLRSLLTYLSETSQVLASSTGPLHLAHALGIPVFGVYPQKPIIQSFKRWRPAGYWHKSPVEWLEF